MQSTVLTTIAATGFSVAFFHAAIPTHWLPFVLVSRARGWSRSAKTLAVIGRWPGWGTSR
jgi:nickel/cobalt exporter